MTVKVLLVVFVFIISSVVSGQDDFDSVLKRANQELNNQVNDLADNLNEMNNERTVHVSSDGEAALGIGAIIGINIGAFVLLVGCCVLICRCCCGCCQKSSTYVHTTVVSQQPTAPATVVNLGYPSAPGYAPVPSNPIDQGIGNPMYAANYNTPPPQYSSK